MTYTDSTGQEWRVREFVSREQASYAQGAPVDGTLPTLVRFAVIFETERGRRIADDAPADWRERPELLDALFERARRPTVEH